MWRAPGSVMAVAALLAGAALAGCGIAAEPPAVVAVSPPAPEASPLPVAVAQPHPSLAPPVGVPEPPVPTASFRPVSSASTPSASAAPSPEPSPGPSAAASPAPSAAASPAPSPAPSGTPAPSSQPLPASLVALLPRAGALGPREWRDESGSSSAAWAELSAPRGISPAAALPHVAAARSAGDACAAAADAVDGRAVEAASVSLTAGSMPGAPVDLVLVRYPSAEAAESAVLALQALGDACEGVATEDGTLGSGTPLLSARAVLAGDSAALVIDATSRGDLLVAVLHEGAPPEAVAALAAAQLGGLP